MGERIFFERLEYIHVQANQNSKFFKYIKDNEMATVPGGTFDVSDDGANLIKLINWTESLYVDLTQTTVVGGSGTLTVAGGGQGDTIITGGVAGIFRGNAGNDLINASSNDSVIGGGSDQLIFGGAGNDYIIGGIGNDQVTLRGAADGKADASGEGITFVFRANSGKDVIEGFDLTKDVIKLRNIDGIESVKDVLKHASQSGDNVVIKLGDGNKITLLNVDLADLKKNPGDHFDVG
jgi:Ca2+-binding RTX toxin-like protein